MDLDAHALAVGSNENYSRSRENIPWLGLGGCDGDVVLLGIVEKIIATRVAVIKFREAPWGNDLDRWLWQLEKFLAWEGQ